MIEERTKNNTYDSLRLAFFGGEPLISFDTVALPLARRIKELVEQSGKHFQSFFVTNATLYGTMQSEIDGTWSHKRLNLHNRDIGRATGGIS